MTKLTGSTKRSEWERRWGHELPRDWERGRIQVNGDGAWNMVQKVATLALVFLTAGALVLLAFGK